MEWKHKCDINWLRERQKFLTATDIKNLLPVTKTGRKREVGDADYMKVMANKMTMITEEDCLSYGAAARGHIMEPYAINALNDILVEMNGNFDEQFYHWDDKIIHRHGRLIAFSPDAMDIQMNASNEEPHAIAEVKSYSAEKHLITAYTPKDQIEERWQIATAMALLDSIDHAFLVLFNPKMKYRKTFVIRFDRDELANEIKTILDVEEKWREFRESGPLTKRPANGAIHSHHGGNETNIMHEVELRQKLNP